MSDDIKRIAEALNPTIPFSKRIPAKVKGLTLYEEKFLLTKALREEVRKKINQGETGWHVLPDVSGKTLKLYINQDNQAFVYSDHEAFVLGAGACGKVYITQNALTGKWHCMKKLKSGALNNMELHILMKEGIYTSSEQSIEQDFFIGELIQGETLNKFLEKNQLSFEQAFAFVISLTEAYESLHRQDLVHRDIKKDNVMVDKEQRKCIAIDFGSVQPIGLKTKVTGAYVYRSLEILNGAPYSFMDDIYALGFAAANILSPSMHASLYAQIPLCEVDADRARYRDAILEKQPNLKNDIQRHHNDIYPVVLGSRHPEYRETLIPTERELCDAITKMTDPPQKRYKSIVNIVDDMRNVREKHIQHRMQTQAFSSTTRYNEALQQLYSHRESLINTFAVFFNKSEDGKLSTVERESVLKERAEQRALFIKTSSVLDNLDTFLLRCVDAKTDNRPSVQEINQYIDIIQKTNKKELEDKLKHAGIAQLKKPSEKDPRMAEWLSAFKNGEKSIIELITREQNLVNTPLLNGHTIAYLAAQYGDVTAIMALQAAGADLNKPSKNGLTPMFVAAEKGHAAMIAELKKAGADVNMPCKGFTPIYVAAANGHTAAIAALRVAGADLNTLSDGCTPVYIAAENGYAKAIEALTLGGANVFIPNKQGKTPINIAIELGYTTAQTVLEEHAANITTLVKPLVTAIKEHADLETLLEVITNLKSKGLDLNTILPDGYTLVHLAVKHRHTAAIVALKATGADVNIPSNGVTPIYAAAEKGHTKIIKALQAVGANVDALSNGFSPVYVAAEKGCAETITTLSALGADVNIPSKYGITPVYAAAEKGDKAVIEALQAAGADMNTPSKHHGITPAYAAAKRRHIEIVKILQVVSGVDVNMLLHTAIKDGDLQAIETLIKAGADVNMPLESVTPVYAAVEKGHIEIVKILQAAGADVNMPSNGFTPVYVAAERGNAPMITALKAAGADMDTPSKYGVTPTYAAAENGHTEAVQALQAAGANINTPSKHHGMAPAEAAAKKGHKATVEVLQAATRTERADFTSRKKTPPPPPPLKPSQAAVQAMRTAEQANMFAQQAAAAAARAEYAALTTQQEATAAAKRAQIAKNAERKPPPPPRPRSSK